MKETSIYKVTIHDPKWTDWVHYFVGTPTQDKLIAAFEFQRDQLLAKMEHGSAGDMQRVFDSDAIRRRCVCLSSLIRTCSMPNADSTARTCVTSRKFGYNEITIEKLEAIQL